MNRITRLENIKKTKPTEQMEIKDMIWQKQYEGIIVPVVMVSVLTSLIIYIYHWNLQFLNNVIIIKTKVLLPQVYVTLLGIGCPF